MRNIQEDRVICSLLYPDKNLGMELLLKSTETFIMKTKINDKFNVSQVFILEWTFLLLEIKDH